MTIELPDAVADDVEDLLKSRMVRILPWAVREGDNDHRAEEYGRLARALRELLEQKPHERRVRVIDYPTDEGRLWMDLEIDAEPDVWGGCVAWKEGSA